MPLGGVNALVGLKLPADVLAGNSLVVSRPWGAAVGVWWGAAPGELSQVLDSRDSQVRKIAPLDVVVDDPDLLWVFDGQALAAVHSKGVAKSPVLPPFAIEDLLCCLYGHLHHIVQNEFLLGHVWARDRHKDVLETSVPRPVEKRDWFVREGFFVVLEQKLLGLVACE